MLKRRIRRRDLVVFLVALSEGCSSWSPSPLRSPLFIPPKPTYTKVKLSPRVSQLSKIRKRFLSLFVSNRPETDKSTLSAESESELQRLRQENDLLKNVIRQLEIEKDRPSKIVIETFEGKPSRKDGPEAAWYADGNLAPLPIDADGITMSGVELESTSLWCDELGDNDTCPVEPRVSFWDAMRDRACWLVGLLALQSCSGFILARNEELLENHPVIIFFLTMLVGAGGNAGNQASVRVIRGLALGTLNEATQSQFLWRELKMASALSLILSAAGFARAFVFRTPFPETIAVTSALALIVFSSICLGAVLPIFLKNLGVDPAHSSTTIQVVMDILGVVLTVLVSTAILDSPLGQTLVGALS